MPWVKIDDHFDEHPKLSQIGPLGWGIWLAGIAYCNRNLTDGFIPWSNARRLASFEIVEDDGKLWELSRSSGYAGETIDADWVIGLLVEAGLWEEVHNGRGRIDGYRIHDYDQYQPTKEQVLAERESAKERMRKKRSSDVRTNADDVQPNIEDVQQKFNDPVPVPELTPSTTARELEPDVIEPTIAELEVARKIQQIRGMANVSETVIVGHLREILQIRGSPVSKRAILADASRFRDHWNVKRANQPPGEPWKRWKTAMSNWFERTEDRSDDDRQRARNNANGRAATNPGVPAEGLYADPRVKPPTVTGIRRRLGAGWQRF